MDEKSYSGIILHCYFENPASIALSLAK